MGFRTGAGEKWEKAMQSVSDCSHGEGSRGGEQNGAARVLARGAAPNCLGFGTGVWVNETLKIGVSFPLTTREFPGMLSGAD